MLLDTPSAQIGWNSRAFELSDPEGKSYKLSDLQGENGLLIAFICNHCPYVIKIINRLVDDAKLLQAEGINVVAINSNDYQYVEEDSPAKMLEFSARYGFTFPYLVDEDQLVAKMYGAVCTPDFFGFNSAGELQYRGRLDDAKMSDPANRKAELLDSMRQISKTGHAANVQHSSIGCSIKWK
ncbi:MAG: hypothetical protein OFPI_21780 [Osedax symbiont Rs2]|nr:MAG: hypothetical protein OFPI_21780 [Osedax symbiont Rs2]